jgi:hypothetical protein
VLGARALDGEGAVGALGEERRMQPAVSEQPPDQVELDQAVGRLAKQLLEQARQLARRLPA